MFSKVKSLFLVSLLICAVILIGVVPLAQASPPKEIKIGVVMPLSGALASTGKDLRGGYELAEDIINSKYPGLDIAIAGWEGIPNLGGAKIKLIFMDHRADPAIGADLAKRLIMDEKVVALLGCYNSSVTKTVSTVAEKYGVPMLNPNSSSPALTMRGLNWFWRVSPHDGSFTVDLFNFLKGLTEGKVRGVGKVPKEEINTLATAAENTEYGSAAKELIEEIAPEYGYQVLESFKYPHQAADLTSEAGRLMASGAKVYLFVPYISDAILYIRTLKSLKAAPNIIWAQDAGFINPDFPKLGKDISGTITRSVFIPKMGEKKPTAAKINEIFKEKTGHDFTGASARSFTGTQTIAHVLNEAGSTDPKTLQKTLNEIRVPGKDLVVAWEGIEFGAARPGEKGQNILATGMIGQWQWKDGENVLEVVYPFDLATADFIYPFPGWK